MKNISLALVLLFTASAAFGAKTTCFTGRAGVEGGDRFSVAENWDNALPVAGDTVIVSSVVEKVINDFDSGSTFKSLYLMKNETVDFAPELVGNPVVLTDKLYLYGGSKNFLDVTLTDGTGNFYLGGEDGECHGRIQVNGNCFLYIMNSKTLKLYGPLRVEGTIGSNPNAYRHGSLRLCSVGNRFNDAKIWYNKVFFDVPHAVDPIFVINWGNTYLENNRGMYVFGENDQTADRISWTPSNNTLVGYQISGSGVLTLNGTADALSPCLIEGSLSVVWNPSGDYVQTFTNRAHTTSGSLTVSNGTMRLAAGGSFKNVKELAVAKGAVFDLATPSAETFKALKMLALDGTFAFAPGAANPFASADLYVEIGEEGVFVIPEGVTIPLPRVRVSGAFPAPGVYGSECGWISGGGKVEVSNSSLSSWGAPVSGRWSDATKWSDGAVPGENPAYVTVQGADYDVEFDSPVFTPAEINLGNTQGRKAKLVVNSDATLSESRSTVFNVAQGGVFEIRSGYVGLTNGVPCLVSLSGGGEWRVCGGTNDIMTENWTGFSIGDGTLAVTSGLFRVKNTKWTYAPGCSLSGGAIRLSGTGIMRAENNQGEFNPFGSGLVEVKDDSFLYLGRAFAGPDKTDEPLRIEVKDRATLDADSALCLGSTRVGGETTVSVSDNAKLDLGSKGAIGLNCPCKVRLDVFSGASVTVGGYGFSIGGLIMKKDSSGAYPTGVVHVAGGSFYGGGHFYGQKDFLGVNVYQGVLIGSPDPSSGAWNGPARYHGELHIGSGGTYEQSGYLSLGVGPGDGTMTVDGGNVTAKNGEVLVGGCGGNGEIAVSAGTVKLQTSLFAGGFDVSGLSIPRTWTNLDHESLSSTGRVVVSGGTLAVSGGMTFGSRGTGFLEIGSNGVVTASSLTLSNRVASALSFRFGADGIGKIELSGPLVVADGAKLKIDASGYRGRKGRFRLVKAESVDGAFAAENVELDGGDVELSSYFRDGSLFVVRHTGFTMVVR